MPEPQPAWLNLAIGMVESTTEYNYTELPTEVRDAIDHAARHLHDWITW
jgi:hypothetical protein